MTFSKNFRDVLSTSRFLLKRNVKMRLLSTLLLLTSFSLIAIRAMRVCDKLDDGERIRISNFKGNQEYLVARRECGSPDLRVMIFSYCSVNGLYLDLEYLVKRYPDLEVVSWSCVGGCSYSPVEGLLVRSRCKGNYYYYYLYLSLYMFFYQIQFRSTSMRSFYSQLERCSTELHQYVLDQ